jgi:hypothetical protein
MTSRVRTRFYEEYSPTPPRIVRGIISPWKPRRSDHRLHPNVYLGGLWYITICSYRRKEVFSVIEDGVVHKLDIGRIIEEELLATPKKLSDSRECVDRSDPSSRD